MRHPFPYPAFPWIGKEIWFLELLCGTFHQVLWIASNYMHTNINKYKSLHLVHNNTSAEWWRGAFVRAGARAPADAHLSLFPAIIHLIETLTRELITLTNGAPRRHFQSFTLLRVNATYRRPRHCRSNDEDEWSVLLEAEAAYILPRFVITAIDTVHFNRMLNIYIIMKLILLIMYVEVKYLS